MPSILAAIRPVLCALAGSLALLCVAAQAQEVPEAKITGNDLRRALIWTGHLSLLERGDPVIVFRKAFQSWQVANGHTATETLPDEQMGELIADGERQRDMFGWATLEDKSIGFSIGVPTKLVKFVAARSDSGSLWYDFEGGVRYTLLVRYGDLNCGNINYIYSRLRAVLRGGTKVQYADGFAFAGESGGITGYARFVCRPSGTVMVGIDFPTSEADKFQVLMSALPDSLSIRRTFNPTAIPHPKLDAPPAVEGSPFVAAAARPSPASKPPGKADAIGKTDAIKRATREGAELSVEEVFDKASAAVYKVNAGDRLGSAVAISARELLTNCHVVKDKPRVTIVHDKKELPADVASVDEKADRCVLRTNADLAKWVTVRPYDDIKIGERAVTIGTPHGLELTVAEGVVSSKRTIENARFVQTSAPISPGSSGGGLFDLQGHLLGITTFQMKTGQNLNFAIAAEDFAK